MRGTRARSLRLGKEALKRPAHWEPACGSGGRPWGGAVGRAMVSFQKRTCSSTFEDVIRIVHPKIK